jgi:hypothetical protein
MKQWADTVDIHITGIIYMAIGDSKKPGRFDELIGLGAFNLNTDVMKWVFITEGFSSIDENSADIGLSNFTQIGSSGNYVANSTLANSAWSRTGNVSKLDFDDFSFEGDGANPTTAKTIALYDDTSAGKEVFKFIDITVDGGTTPADTTIGFSYTAAAGGSFTITTN